MLCNGQLLRMQICLTYTFCQMSHESIYEMQTVANGCHCHQLFRRARYAAIVMLQKSDRIPSNATQRYNDNKSPVHRAQTQNSCQCVISWCILACDTSAVCLLIVIIQFTKNIVLSWQRLSCHLRASRTVKRMCVCVNKPTMILSSSVIRITLRTDSVDV